jgi:hypothetical protein
VRISNKHRGPGLVLTLAVMAMMALAAFARPASLPAQPQGPVLSVAESPGKTAIEAWNATSLFLARQQESARAGLAELSDDGADDDREALGGLVRALAVPPAPVPAMPRPDHTPPHDASAPARIHARAPPCFLTA